MGNVQMEASMIRYGSGTVKSALDNGGGGGGASTLAALTDTSISSPSNGQILTYDSSASKWKNAAPATVAAGSVTFDGTTSSMEATNVQAAIDEIVVNFQDGVDDVYDACVAKGSTPASHSLSDVVTAIGNISGGGGMTQVNPFGSAQTLTLYDANGVSVTTSEIDSAGTLDFTASEGQAGYEGFVIELNSTAGKSYLLEFDMQVDSSSQWWDGSQYRFGFALASAADTNYQDQRVPENIPRNYAKNHLVAATVATGSKMYVNFNVCGFSDAQTNAFTISDFKLYELS